MLASSPGTSSLNDPFCRSYLRPRFSVRPLPTCQSSCTYPAKTLMGMFAYVGSEFVYCVGYVVGSFTLYGVSRGNVQLPSGEPVLSPSKGTLLKSTPIFHWWAPPQ